VSYTRAAVPVETAQAVLTGPGGRQVWCVVEIARTPSARAQGLQGRVLAPGRGMLFVFETEGPQVFWMRNTPAPLDMVFADRSGRVTGIVHRARPFDSRTVGGFTAKDVLELRGGEAQRLGIGPGWTMSMVVV
jgi:hypothetical protein